MLSIQPLTESSCILYLGEHIDPAVSVRVCRAAQLIRDQLAAEVIDMVPSYSSIHLTVDIGRCRVGEFMRRLEATLADFDNQVLEERAGKLVRVPVYYGSEVAPDLDEVAELTGLSTAEVIELHTAQRYRVYAIGFSPGFCFMGNTDPRLAVARKASPRTQVPTGSVGLADRQTAVYPSTSPGGWQIIGRTAVDMVALCNHSDSPLQVGDEVCFEAVDREQFIQAGGAI